MISLLLALIIESNGWAAGKTVKVTFQNVEFAPKVRLFEVKPNKQADISETKIVRDIKNAPLEGEIKGPVEVPVPGTRTFALVVENKTDKELFFFASPHVVHPSEQSLGFQFECLCVHHVFQIPPQRVWYRIVRIIFDGEAKHLPAEINHSIIGIKPDVARSEYAKRIYPYRNNNP